MYERMELDMFMLMFNVEKELLMDPGKIVPRLFETSMAREGRDSSRIHNFNLTSTPPFDGLIKAADAARYGA
jgi:hypothetical protein